MNLDKLTEHINEKHRDQVDELIRHFGQNWETNFVSATHLGMNNFYLLPSDLRVCSGMLFGSETHLLNHFKDVHSKAGLSIDKESDADLSEREEKSERSSNSRGDLIRRLLFG